MKHLTLAIVLSAVAVSLTTEAEAQTTAKDPPAKDGETAQWQTFIRRTSPCLIPTVRLTSEQPDAPAPLPMLVPTRPRDDEPPLRMMSGSFSLYSALSANGNFLHGELTLPALNFALGMTLVSKTFGNFVSMEKDWRTSQGLLRLHADIGKVHPFVEGSFLSIDPRIIAAILPDLDPSAPIREDRRQAELLSATATRSPYWFGGLTFDLGRGFTVSIGGTALLIDGPFYAGAIIFSIPLGPKR